MSNAEEQGHQLHFNDTSNDIENSDTLAVHEPEFSIPSFEEPADPERVEGLRDALENLLPPYPLSREPHQPIIYNIEEIGDTKHDYLIFLSSENPPHTFTVIHDYTVGAVPERARATILGETYIEDEEWYGAVDIVDDDNEWSETDSAEDEATDIEIGEPTYRNVTSTYKFTNLLISEGGETYSHIDTEHSRRTTTADANGNVSKRYSVTTISQASLDDLALMIATGRFDSEFQLNAQEVSSEEA